MHRNLHARSAFMTCGANDLHGDFIRGSLSREETWKIVARLRRTIKEQVRAGVVFFGAGSAQGFDTLVA